MVVTFVCLVLDQLSDPIPDLLPDSVVVLRAKSPLSSPLPTPADRLSRPTNRPGHHPSNRSTHRKAQPVDKAGCEQSIKQNNSLTVLQNSRTESQTFGLPFDLLNFERHHQLTSRRAIQAADPLTTNPSTPTLANHSTQEDINHPNSQPRNQITISSPISYNGWRLTISVWASCY